jgi:hypothetical protein
MGELFAHEITKRDFLGCWVVIWPIIKEIFLDFDLDMGNLLLDPGSCQFLKHFDSSDGQKKWVRSIVSKTFSSLSQRVGIVPF